MLGIRHEEYTEFGGSVPFAIEFGIKRSKTIYSAEVNWHENLEIQLCRAGEGTVMLDGKKISVTAGDIVVVNSGVLHHTGTETEIEYDCLIPDTGLCRLVGIDVTKVSSVLRRGFVMRDALRNIHDAADVILTLMREHHDGERLSRLPQGDFHAKFKAPLAEQRHPAMRVLRRS